MKLTTSFATSLLFVAAALADTETLSFDNAYDNAGGSLSNVVCSTGTNGLITKGFKTFGQLPTFPNIGGSQAIGGFNSAECGSCWSITFGNNTILVTAIDHAGSGFNIAEAAMNTLTNNQAESLGRVNVQATQVAPVKCGLKA